MNGYLQVNDNKVLPLNQQNFNYSVMQKMKLYLLFANFSFPLIKFQLFYVSEQFHCLDFFHYKQISIRCEIKQCLLLTNRKKVAVLPFGQSLSDISIICKYSFINIAKNLQKIYIFVNNVVVSFLIYHNFNTNGVSKQTETRNRLEEFYYCIILLGTNKN